MGETAPASSWGTASKKLAKPKNSEVASTFTNASLHSVADDGEVHGSNYISPGNVIS